MKDADRQVFRLTCKNPDCGLVVATSGDPTALQKRFALGGCPYCTGKEFSANYEKADFAEREVVASALSVIVPFFGVEPFAKDCIESILAQDVSPMDLYLVDDGSRDACPKILDSFLTDERVVVIHQKNAGLSMARNRALEFVHSEYVTFVDGDDKLLDNPSGYSHVLASLKESGADLAYYSYVLHAEGEEPALPDQLHRGGYVLRDKKESLDFFFDRLETIYCSAAWNKMARASLFSSARYYPNVYCEDLRMMPNLLRQMQFSITLEEYLVSYMTMRKGSISAGVKPKLLFDRMMAIRDCLDFAKELGDERYITITASAFAKYLAPAYYAAWKGTSPDPEERKKQKSPAYMRAIKAAYREEKKTLLNKAYLPNAKQRTALRLFGLSKYLFLIHNRVFHAFDL